MPRWMTHEDEIRKLVKSVYKPVAMPPEFKKRLLERLMREVGSAAKTTDEGGCETRSQGF